VLEGILRNQVLFQLLIVLLLSTFGFSQDTGFLDRTVNVVGKTFRYQVYVPRNWNKNQKWPVILFLHGSGERGYDGIKQTAVGLPQALRLNSDKWPFVVVMPQCEDDHWWTGAEQEQQALKALDASIAEFNGDPARVYLTGLSMGGYGTYDIAARNPGKFAALAPVCGGVVNEDWKGPETAEFPNWGSQPYKAVAEKLGKTPVWIFHGDIDDSIPVRESREMFAALKAAGGDVRYTEYPGVKHNSWDNAYWAPELPVWLLAHRLGK
jgi:predicted peptidase